MFIEKSIQRYKQFLYLRKSHPSHFIVPCYDIDIVWHVHQVYPILYKNETEQLLREHFNHDDSVNDRRSGSKLETSSVVTRTLWQKTFNQDYSCFGCMYRGTPLNGKLATSSYRHLLKNITKTRSVECIRISIPEKNEKIKVKKIHSISLELRDASQSYNIIKFSPEKCESIPDDKCIQWSFNRDNMLKSTQIDGYLHLEIEKKIGYLKLLRREKPTCITGTVPYQDIISDIDEVNCNYKRTVRLDLTDGSVADVELAIEVVNVSPLRLSLPCTISNSLTTTWTGRNRIHSKDIEKVWGPIDLAQIDGNDTDVSRTTIK